MLKRRIEALLTDGLHHLENRYARGIVDYRSAFGRVIHLGGTDAIQFSQGAFDVPRAFSAEHAANGKRDLLRAHRRPRSPPHRGGHLGDRWGDLSRSLG